MGSTAAYDPNRWRGAPGCRHISAITVPLPRALIDPGEVRQRRGLGDRIRGSFTHGRYRGACPLRARGAFVAVLCGGILAMAVQRSQGMTSRALSAERSRANLARYFSPSMVDQLSTQDQPFGAPKGTDVGVLFADIVGFTRIAEASTPVEVISLLREFHGRVARVVFEHEGTLDKFIGDSVMATFGTPANSPTDATRTVACCLAIAAEIDIWNTERTASGLTPVRIGIGAHFGRVVVGDIGDERRLEFAVLGDTVNVASRLEALTRTLSATILISGDLVAAARREGDAASGLLARLGEVGAQRLRNREEAIAVWAYPSEQSAHDTWFPPE